tara:strand:- start:10315 stop:10857 length:543 start_codon:yes stop_codon:yes gene_type:complete
MLDEMKARLEASSINVISESKQNLQKENKVGELSNSLRYEVEDDGFAIIFLGTDYGSFVDQGVQGANPNKLPRNAKWFGINKAPTSQFRFGSGTGQKGGLRGAIDKWVVSKPIMSARNKKGQFIPRKSLTFLISRSIYLSGIKTTNFFTNPFNKMKTNLIKELNFAFAEDIQETIFKNNE